MITNPRTQLGPDWQQQLRDDYTTAQAEIAARQAETREREAREHDRHIRNCLQTIGFDPQAATITTHDLAHNSHAAEAAIDTIHFALSSHAGNGSELYLYAHHSPYQLPYFGPIATREQLVQAWHDYEHAIHQQARATQIASGRTQE